MRKENGCEFCAEIPPREKVVGMCVSGDQIIIACTHGVFELKDNKLVPIPFEVPKLKV